MAQNTILERSHRRGIKGMAFTELWERFSFYGLQTLLPFYLIYDLNAGGLALSKPAAAGIVGAYGGAVYVAQLLGAWLGERVISPKRLVLWGGVVIALGHLALGIIPGMAGLGLGLAFLIVGTGCLETNITSIVGFILEGSAQSRRDAGFSYFYMGINFGSVFGPLVTGFTQNEWGFRPGFFLAAIGMVISLTQYVVSSRTLPERAGQVTRPISAKGLRNLLACTVLAVLLIAALAAGGVLTASYLATVVTAGTLVAAAIYFFVIYNSKKVSRAEKTRVATFVPFFIVSGLYFGFLYQKFTAISFLIDERVNRSIGSWEFPVGWVTMVSALAGFLAAPLFARLWTKFGDRQPTAATKFGLGAIQIGVAFLFMLLVSGVVFQHMIPVWLVLVYMAIAGSSEFFVGPIGLALATKIAPRAYATQMVALNFLTLALGLSLSGLFGQLAEAVSPTSYFAVLGIGAIVAGVLIIAARRFLHERIYSGLE